METLFTGVDISKKDFHVALTVSTQESDTKAIKVKSFQNDKKGINAFVKYLTAKTNKLKCKKAHVVMESTGVYGNKLSFALAENEIGFSIVNPRQILDFIRSKNLRAKTDKVDAKAIAEYGVKVRPRKSKLPKKEVRELRVLNNVKRNLKRDLIRIKGEQEYITQDKYKHSYAVKTLISQEKFLNKRIDKIDKEIDRIIEKSEVLKQDCMLLQSIPGIKDSAKEIVVEFHAMPEGMKNNQIVAYAGLAPAPKQSGTSLNKKGHLDKRGNKYLRQALYMPALSAIRCNAVINPYYEKKLKEGMPKKKALLACVRKLLCLCIGVLKHQKPFDPNWRKKTA